MFPGRIHPLPKNVSRQWDFLGKTHSGRAAPAPNACARQSVFATHGLPRSLRDLAMTEEERSTDCRGCCAASQRQLKYDTALHGSNETICTKIPGVWEWDFLLLFPGKYCIFLVCMIYYQIGRLCCMQKKKENSLWHLRKIS